LASAGNNATGGLLGSAFGGLLSRSGGGSAGVLQGPTQSGATLDTAGGGIFSFFSSLFRANGGPVAAGQPYTVGEMGRELFVPNADGRVMPIAAGAGGYGGTQVTVGGDNINITSAQGVTPAQMVSALAQRDQQFRRNINGIVADGQRRYQRA